MKLCIDCSEVQPVMSEVKKAIDLLTIILHNSGKIAECIKNSIQYNTPLIEDEWVECCGVDLHFDIEDGRQVICAYPIEQVNEAVKATDTDVWVNIIISN
jgi:hypothetical protein